MNYREIKYNEIEKFYRLISAFCSETNADNDALSVVIKRLEEGRTFTFAAEENGKIFGVIGYCRAGDAAIPDFFYVLPDKRGKAIGGILYRMGTEHAKKAGIKKIVPIVTEDKESLYTKIGFKRKFILLEKEI